MSTHLDSELLRTFIEVAKTASFTLASKNIYRTQSAVSIQIKKLEEILNQKLFLRKPQGVSLTPAGEKLLEKAKRIIILLDKTKKSFKLDFNSNIIRLGMPDIYGPVILPELLQKFSAVSPKTQISIHCGNSETFYDLVDQDKLDLFIALSDSNDKKGEILFHDPLIWVTSMQHSAHKLNPLPLAVYEKNCLWREWMLKSLDEKSFNYRIAYSSSDGNAIKSAVLSGSAITVLGRSALPIGARILTQKDGFPKLPCINIKLFKQLWQNSENINNLTSIIKDLFNNKYGGNSDTAQPITWAPFRDFGPMQTRVNIG